MNVFVYGDMRGDKMKMSNTNVVVQSIANSFKSFCVCDMYLQFFMQNVRTKL